MDYVVAADAGDFLRNLRDESVDLFLIDPPYHGIVRELWDNQWETPEAYADWLVGLCEVARRKAKPNASLIVFQAAGKHGSHPIFQVIEGIERTWHFRNWIVWKKSRVFGKKNDYLYCRDEILWFSASSKPKEVTFNTPFLSEKPKKANPKHEFKRVSNVWDDIQQEFRPARTCQRPLPLISRLILAHSNPGDLVVDFFAGYGTTGIVAHHLKRRFLGCETIPDDAVATNLRVARARHISSGMSAAPSPK